MSPSELEIACQNFFTLKEKSLKQKAKLEEVELETLAETEKLQTLQIMAELRGETLPAVETKKLEELQVEIKTTENEIENLQNEILTALKDFTLPVPLREPEIDKDKSAIPFEGEPHANTVQFLASVLDSTVPVRIDDTELYPDKAVVVNVTNPKQAAISLRIFRDNVRRLARVTLGEKDSDIEQVAEYLYGSVYKEIWEAIKGKREVSNQDLFAVLNADDSKDKKKVRNFFTNLGLVLKDKNPFNNRPDKIHELNFFGVLVWKRYKELYMKIDAIEEKTEEKIDALNENEKEVEQEVKGSKNENRTLNGYFNPKEIKDTLYGEKVD